MKRPTLVAIRWIVTSKRELNFCFERRLELGEGIGIWGGGTGKNDVKVQMFKIEKIFASFKLFKISGWKVSIHWQMTRTGFSLCSTMLLKKMCLSWWRTLLWKEYKILSSQMAWACRATKQVDWPCLWESALHESQRVFQLSNMIPMTVLFHMSSVHPFTGGNFDMAAPRRPLCPQWLNLSCALLQNLPAEPDFPDKRGGQTENRYFSVTFRTTLVNTTSLQPGIRM